MKPEEHDEIDALRALYRDASAGIDAPPDPSVRTTVLAAAARAVDARPHDVDGQVTAVPTAAPFGRHRWPVSMAALLVVSLMTGLVFDRAMRDEPDRVTSASAPQPPAPTSAPTPAPSTAFSAASQDDRTTAEPASPASAKARAVPVAPKRERPPVGVERADRGVPDAKPAPAADAPARLAPKVAAAPVQESAPAEAAPAFVPAPAPPSASAPLAANPARASPAINTAQRIRRGPEPLTPEAWVDRIVKLREAGDDAAADREVETLRARHPDFEIPAAALGRSGTR